MMIGLRLLWNSDDVYESCVIVVSCRFDYMSKHTFLLLLVSSSQVVCEKTYIPIHRRLYDTSRV